MIIVSNTKFLAQGFLALLLCVLLTGCNFGTASHPGFELDSVMLPGDGYYASMWDSAVSGQLGFTVRDRDRKVDDRGWSVGLSIDANNQINEAGAMPRLPNAYPKLLFGDGLALLKRGGVREDTISVVSFPGGEEQSFMLPKTSIVPGEVGLSRLGFWPEFGLARFYQSLDSDSVRVWAGSEELSLTDERTGVLALGWGFIAGRLTAAIVLQDGSVELFDPATFKFAPLQSMEWLAAFAKEIEFVDGMRYRFAFSEKVAAMSLKDTMMCINSTGQIHHIRQIYYYHRDYKGRLRARALGNPNDVVPEDALEYKDEGRKAGTKSVGKRTVLKPLDDSRIIIFDMVYQRLIIVGTELEADQP